MGQRVKFQPDLKRVEQLASTGLTIKQICSVLDVHEATLYRHKAKSREFREAIEKGQRKGIAIVTNALMEQAKSGNLGAQIFYLKNRDKENWKDKQDLEHSGGMENTITIVDPGCGHVGPETDKS